MNRKDAIQRLRSGDYELIESVVTKYAFNGMSDELFNILRMPSMNNRRATPLYIIHLYNFDCSPYLDDLIHWMVHDSFESSIESAGIIHDIVDDYWELLEETDPDGGHMYWMLNSAMFLIDIEMKKAKKMEDERLERINMIVNILQDSFAGLVTGTR